MTLLRQFLAELDARIDVALGETSPGGPVTIASPLYSDDFATDGALGSDWTGDKANFTKASGSLRKSAGGQSRASFGAPIGDRIFRFQYNIEDGSWNDDSTFFWPVYTDDATAGLRFKLESNASGVFGLFPSIVLNGASTGLRSFYRRLGVSNRKKGDIVVLLRNGVMQVAFDGEWSSRQNGGPAWPNNVQDVVAAGYPTSALTGRVSVVANANYPILDGISVTPLTFSMDFISDVFFNTQSGVARGQGVIIGTMPSNIRSTVTGWRMQDLRDGESDAPWTVVPASKVVFTGDKYKASVELSGWGHRKVGFGYLDADGKLHYLQRPTQLGWRIGGSGQSTMRGLGSGYAADAVGKNHGGHAYWRSLGFGGNPDTFTPPADARGLWATIYNNYAAVPMGIAAKQIADASGVPSYGFAGGVDGSFQTSSLPGGQVWLDSRMEPRGILRYFADFDQWGSGTYEVWAHSQGQNNADTTDGPADLDKATFTNNLLTIADYVGEVTGNPSIPFICDTLGAYAGPDPIGGSWIRGNRRRQQVKQCGVAASKLNPNIKVGWSSYGCYHAGGGKDPYHLGADPMGNPEFSRRLGYSKARALGEKLLAQGFSTPGILRLAATPDGRGPLPVQVVQTGARSFKVLVDLNGCSGLTDAITRATNTLAKPNDLPGQKNGMLVSADNGASAVPIGTIALLTGGEVGYAVTTTVDLPTGWSWAYCYGASVDDETLYYGTYADTTDTEGNVVTRAPIPLFTTANWLKPGDPPLTEEDHGWTKVEASAASVQPNPVAAPVEYAVANQATENTNSSANYIEFKPKYGDVWSMDVQNDGQGSFLRLEARGKDGFWLLKFKNGQQDGDIIPGRGLLNGASFKDNYQSLIRFGISESGVATFTVDGVDQFGFAKEFLQEQGYYSPDRTYLVVRADRGFYPTNDLHDLKIGPYAVPLQILDMNLDPQFNAVWNLYYTGSPLGFTTRTLAKDGSVLSDWTRVTVVENAEPGYAQLRNTFAQPASSSADIQLAVSDANGQPIDEVKTLTRYRPGTPSVGSNLQFITSPYRGTRTYTNMLNQSYILAYIGPGETTGRAINQYDNPDILDLDCMPLKAGVTYGIQMPETHGLHTLEFTITGGQMPGLVFDKIEGEMTFSNPRTVNSTTFRIDVFCDYSGFTGNQVQYGYMKVASLNEASPPKGMFLTESVNDKSKRFLPAWIARLSMLPGPIRAMDLVQANQPWRAADYGGPAWSLRPRRSAITDQWKGVCYEDLIELCVLTNRPLWHNINAELLYTADGRDHLRRMYRMMYEGTEGNFGMVLPSGKRHKIEVANEAWNFLENYYAAKAKANGRADANMPNNQASWIERLWQQEQQMLIMQSEVSNWANRIDRELNTRMEPSDVINLDGVDTTGILDRYVDKGAIAPYVPADPNAGSYQGNQPASHSPADVVAWLRTFLPARFALAQSRLLEFAERGWGCDFYEWNIAYMAINNRSSGEEVAIRRSQAMYDFMKDEYISGIVPLGGDSCIYSDDGRPGYGNDVYSNSWYFYQGNYATAGNQHWNALVDYIAEQGM